jgi:hypothetical protein
LRAHGARSPRSELGAGGSDSARHLAALMECALHVPGPECVLSVGGRPVLVLWGFAAEGAVPGLAPWLIATSPQPEPVRHPALPMPPAAAIQPPPSALAANAAAPWLRRDWWRWLLLLLLLLLTVLLSLRACAPWPAAVAGAGGALERAEARGQELERHLAELRGQRERVAACPAPAGRSIAEGEPAPAPVVAAEGNAPVTPSAKPVATAPPPEAGPEPPAMPALPRIAEAPPATAVPQPDAGAQAPDCASKRLPSEAPEVAIVVDSSGSMDEPIAGAANRLDAAKRAIGDLVEELPADVDVGLVEFRDCDRIRRDRFYSAGERDQLKAQVQGLHPGKGTPLARSVERAGAILSSRVPAVMIVVTDGEDSCGGDPCAAAAEIRRKRPNLVINVIDIGPAGGSPAACLAEITGGKVYRPGSAVEFDSMVGEAGGQAGPQQCS